MDNQTCSKCGEILATDLPEALCPKCLLRLGFGGLESEEKGTENDVTVVVGEDRVIQEIDDFQTQIDTPISSTVPTAGTKIRYLGDYELIAEIARGGMGIVYRARQVRLNRTVALKMILAGQFASELDVERFHIEAEAAANLDHPGIVPIYEVGEHEGNHYFSMGFIEGDSLASLVSSGPLSPLESATLVLRIAEAIQYAHEKGVIHRDLKPANVLIAPNGLPKVTDFGLAKTLDGDSNLTGTGQILGTPSYMPPEQASGQMIDVGRHSDVYSLGAILYHLITGRPPFQASSAIETLQHVVDRDPIAPRQLNPEIPQDLETICMKCLRKESHNRYESAEELVAELDRFINGKPIHARPVNSYERMLKYAQRNRLSSALACLLVIGISLLLFPISTLDPQVLNAYADVIVSSLTWFWLVAVLVLIYSVREASIRIIGALFKRTFSKSHRTQKPKRSIEDILWNIALGLTIGAPSVCVLMLIIQIIRLLRGEIL